MKKLILGALLLLSTVSFGQWTYKVVNNGFDDPFKKAFSATNNGGWLAMEEGDQETKIDWYTDSNGVNRSSTKIVKNPPILYLYGSYFCDDVIIVDVVLTVGGVNKRYELETIKSRDSKILFFDSDLFSTNIDFYNDFKKSTLVKIRVNESHCNNDYYQFSMMGSTKAFDFLNK